VVVSNDINNRHSPVVIVAAITSKVGRRYPQNVLLPAGIPLPLESMILGNQLTTIAKDRLGAFRGELDAVQLTELARALRISLSL
jgi:mRNA interferase MazF